MVFHSKKKKNVFYLNVIQNNRLPVRGFHLSVELGILIRIK